MERGIWFAFIIKHAIPFTVLGFSSLVGGTQCLSVDLGFAIVSGVYNPPQNVLDVNVLNKCLKVEGKSGIIIRDFNAYYASWGGL